MMTQVRYIADRIFRRGLLALLGGGMVVAGCSRNTLGGAEGTLSLAFERNEEVTLKAGLDVGYALDIVNEAGDTVAHYNDHRTVSSIKLAEGIYTVHAIDNGTQETTDPFGVPRYGGRHTVAVTAGRNTPVLMTCRLVNVKVKVEEFEQAIRDNFTEYSLVVKPTWEYSGRDTLTFTQAEVDAGQEGWINQTDKGRFILIFRAVNRQEPDRSQVYVRTIADAAGADFYRFRVRMNPQGSVSDGGTIFRLSVRTDVNEYDFPLNLKEVTRAIPVVTRADGGNVREPLMTNVEQRAGNARLDIASEAGIQRLRIRHEDADVLLAYGLPGMITLGGENDAATDEAQRAAMAGIVAWKPGSVVGETDTWVDFSDLLNTARPVAASDGAGDLLPEGLYPVELEIYDFDNQMVKQQIVLSVARDFSTDGALSSELVNGVPGVGARYAYVRAKWLGDQTPTGLGFEYRPVGAGDEAWVMVQGATVSVDAAAKSFVGLLTGLTPSTRYEFRPIGDGLAPGSVATFMTEVFTDIPNLDFEGGSTGSFDGASGVFDPNIPGEDRFWATGNPGGKYTMFGIGLDKNVTLPVTGSEAHTGTALWMTSYYVSKAGVTSLATGTVYSGSFGPISSAPTNTNQQRALVHYGRPYTARPLALKGWYKYLPQAINRDIDGKFPELNGQEDKCKIYVSLEVWGTGVSSRPANPTVVGYGELLSGATPVVTDNNGYVPFEFRIAYDADNLVRPDHIVMCATCSYLSDDFCGGEGSTLYIDDFELIWEPTGLAGR